MAHAAALLHYNSAQWLQIFNLIAAHRQPAATTAMADQFIRERGATIA